MKKNSCNNNAFQMHAFQKIQKRAEKSTQKKKKKNYVVHKGDKSVLYKISLKCST